MTPTGRLATHAPSTYKIPVASDAPPIFNTRLHTRAEPDADHLPLQGGRRAAADAGDLGLLGDSRRRACDQPEGTAASSRRPARPNRSSTPFARWTGRPEVQAMPAFRRLIEAIEAEGAAALVTLARVQGSSPREAGARMVVRPSGAFHGTIGGGALEWSALETRARGAEDRARAGVAALARARPRTRAMLRRPGRLANRDFRPPRRRPTFPRSPRPSGRASGR